MQIQKSTRKSKEIINSYCDSFDGCDCDNTGWLKDVINREVFYFTYA